VLRTIFIVLFFLIASCATIRVTSPTDALLLNNVPFFKQDDFQCGPSALGTVLNYWYKRGETGKSLAPQDIISEIYSSSARGVLGIDLELYAKRLGFRTLQYSGSIEDIRSNIDKGIPLIILVDYGISLYQQNHFIVTTGYTKDGIIVNSGRKENELILDEELQKIWKKTGFWTLSITPYA
jgi:ABC-type bacteriocin/lantibiotic exporter with double-glycine peptidase domain